MLGIALNKVKLDLFAERSVLGVINFYAGNCVLLVTTLPVFLFYLLSRLSTNSQNALRVSSA
jgi:hypothetical protein